MNDSTPSNNPRADAAGADPLASALADVARRYEGDDHPSTEHLLAYHLGELDEAAEAMVANHLIGCERCVETLLDLEPLSQPDYPAQPEDPEAPADFERAAAWKQLQPRLGVEANQPTAASSKQAWALAAVLALACLGLSFWVLQLRNEVARGGEIAHTTPPFEAQINVPIAYLDAVTRGETAEESPRLTLPERGIILLIVTPSAPKAYGRYRAEITTLGGELLWESAELTSSELGGVRIALPSKSLPAGELRVRLAERTDDGTESTVESYRLRLERAEAGD